MKQNVIVAIVTLVSTLSMPLHLADDFVRGFGRGRLSSLPAEAILVPWLYGALVLAEWRSGYVIVLLASLLRAWVGPPASPGLRPDPRKLDYPRAMGVASRSPAVPRSVNTPRPTTDREER